MQLLGMSILVVTALFVMKDALGKISSDFKDDYVWTSQGSGMKQRIEMVHIEHQRIVNGGCFDFNQNPDNQSYWWLSVTKWFMLGSAMSGGVTVQQGGLRWEDLIERRFVYIDAMTTDSYYAARSVAGIVLQGGCQSRYHSLVMFNEDRFHMITLIM